MSDNPYASPASEIVANPESIDLEAATRYYTWMKISGFSMLASLVLIFMAAFGVLDPGPVVSAVVLFGGFGVAPLVFLVVTVLFARVTERNPVIWGVMTFFFSPLSLIVVLFKAQSVLDAARSQARAA